MRMNLIGQHKVDWGDAEVMKLRTRKGNDIVSAYVMNPSASLTVLHSHGNASDLGLMCPLFVDLSHKLCVNILAYAYSGYGQSPRKPSEQDTYADIEAAYMCLMDRLGVKEDDVILYGQSLRSGLTLDLAVRLSRLGAVVLHGPIASGLRIMYPIKRTFWFDIYKRIKLRTFHMGSSYGELCQEKYERLWLEGGGHCNLELYPEYLTHFRKFIFAVSKLPRPQVDIPVAAAPRSSGCPSRDVKSRLSVSGHKEKGRRSMDCIVGENSRQSINKGLKWRRSLDWSSSRAQSSSNPPEKPRNSLDRCGEMARSVGLCKVDCLKA